MNIKDQFILDIDKDGFIDQSEIDVMAKVISQVITRMIYAFDFSMFYVC